MPTPRQIQTDSSRGGRRRLSFRPRGNTAVMPTGLMTLPLRLGVRSAKLALGVSERAVGLAWNVAQAFVPGHGSVPTREDAPPFPRQQEADIDEAEGTDEAQDEARATAQNGVLRDPRADFELG